MGTQEICTHEIRKAYGYKSTEGETRESGDGGTGNRLTSGPKRPIRTLARDIPQYPYIFSYYEWPLLPIPQLLAPANHLRCPKSNLR